MASTVVFVAGIVAWLWTSYSISRLNNVVLVKKGADFEVDICITHYKFNAFKRAHKIIVHTIAGQGGGAGRQSLRRCRMGGSIGVLLCFPSTRPMRQWSEPLQQRLIPGETIFVRFVDRRDAIASHHGGRDFCHHPDIAHADVDELVSGASERTWPYFHGIHVRRIRGCSTLVNGGIR